MKLPKQKDLHVKDHNNPIDPLTRKDQDKLQLNQ